MNFGGIGESVAPRTLNVPEYVTDYINYTIQLYKSILGEVKIKQWQCRFLYLSVFLIFTVLSHSEALCAIYIFLYTIKSPKNVLCTYGAKWYLEESKIVRDYYIRIPFTYDCEAWATAKQIKRSLISLKTKTFVFCMECVRNIHGKTSIPYRYDIMIEFFYHFWIQFTKPHNCIRYRSDKFNFSTLTAYLPKSLRSNIW